MLARAAELAAVSASPDREVDLPYITMLYTLLEEAALAFYISILYYFTKDTKYKSILISFLMVLSI
jgi:hypothetical protein